MIVELVFGNCLEIGFGLDCPRTLFDEFVDRAEGSCSYRLINKSLSEYSGVCIIPPLPVRAGGRNKPQGCLSVIVPTIVPVQPIRPPGNLTFLYGLCTTSQNIQALLGGTSIEASCQLVLCLDPCVEPLDDLGQVLRTRQRNNGPILNLDQRMRRVIRGEAATGTRHSASRSMMQKIGRVFGRQSTDRRELFQVLVTAEDRDRELIQEEKRYLLPSARLDSRLARITSDSRQRLLDIR